MRRAPAALDDAPAECPAHPASAVPASAATAAARLGLSGRHFVHRNGGYLLLGLADELIALPAVVTHATHGPDTPVCAPAFPAPASG